MEDAPKDNWYYRFFKIGYKERFPLSATFLTNFTDGMHLSQSLFFLFLSASVVVAIGFSWITFGLVWAEIHVIHFLGYKIFQK